MIVKQIFNLIPPKLNTKVTNYLDFNRVIPVMSSELSGKVVFSTNIDLDKEITSNKDWIILVIDGSRFQIRNANHVPGNLCTIYEFRVKGKSLSIISSYQEYFQKRSSIETVINGVEFARSDISVFFASYINTTTSDFIDKLQSECRTLVDSTNGILKAWSEYVAYNKQDIDLLDGCRLELELPHNKDIIIKFINSCQYYDEFNDGESKFLEFELVKFKRALSDRVFEVYIDEWDSRPRRILSLSFKNDGDDIMVPYVVDGKACGIIIKYSTNIYYNKALEMVEEFYSGEELIANLKDVGKISQIRRYEECLANLSGCNNKESIRVLRWLMEYSNDCGRCLEKDYWEIITDFKNKQLNKEQQDAVQLILNTTDISFIMGPPGTGKTSVIAEAIYQLAKKGNTILLSSQSNDAIDNALDRLKANPDIRAVRLVSRDDYHDKSFDRRYFAWNMVSSLDDDIKEALNKIDTYLKKKAANSKICNEYDSVKKTIYSLAAGILPKDKYAFKNQVKDRYPYSEESIFYKFLKAFINDACGENKRYYDEEIYKLFIIASKMQGNPVIEKPWVDKGVEILKQWSNIEEQIKRQKTIKAAFSIIRDKLNNVENNAELDAETLERAYNEGFYGQLVRTANVYGITCNANNEKLVDGLIHGKVQYDYVIIDEVSKATTLELLAPMLKAPRCILIGDHHQLPPVFLADDELKGASELRYRYEDLITNTFFKKYFDVAPESSKCVLRKQYRMHSEISNIAISNFYKENNGNFILENGLSKEAEEKLKSHGITIRGNSNNNIVVPEHHLYWVDSTPYDSNGMLSNDNSKYEDRQGTTSCANQYEIQGILRLLEKINDAYHAESNHDRKLNVGVISFYSLQNKLLKRSLDEKKKELKNLNIVVNTVDRFQGQEKEVIIVSLVRSKRGKINNFNEFFRKYERINVAFSRAQKLLFIVGSERFCSAQSVPIEYISLKGETNTLDDGNKNNGYAEEFVYKNIIDKTKENNAFFNISELL